ncbi:MAG: hypothetical protein QF681_11850 [Vicinamibacterales bacterium]|nr:hypothetical protein [Vicinamibacterales bacterium]
MLTGTVSLEDRLAMHDKIHLDSRVHRGDLVRILSDQRDMKNQPTADDIDAMVQHASELSSEASTAVRVAAIVTRPVQFGMGRMAEVRFEDVADMKVFYDADEARAWLLRKRPDGNEP